ncbi:hypothetical protein Emtol_2454 [Emticicia oligotrophica DSM 17448]|uniref:Anti-sigma factor n=1 Tax=Emticicia oligotrophica (strain DSM 17448 / CIP 109782 / MTCC 6937 / GPTSA100-15) TaxID=929562 RepID=A0ABN4AMS5_EMTOG|nr:MULTISPECIES: hypothetical protein [Emticicia]AFK03590.1 hypothetical protein Emtol_2454 [Emticicia oligotrophica DSM 17448]
MNNQLERFVRDNRESFDDYEPSVDLWKKIEAKTNPTKPKGKMVGFQNWIGSKPKFALGMVAGFAVFLLISYLGYQYAKPAAQNPDIMALSPSYAKELTHFTSLVEEKRGELKALEKEDPELYHQFDTELTVLDYNYQNLRKELPKNPNQEELLKAMIDNLSMQIDLLNQQLQIIQKIKEAKNGKTNTMV